MPCVWMCERRSSLFAPPGGFEEPGALATFQNDGGLKRKKWTGYRAKPQKMD